MPTTTFHDVLVRANVAEADSSILEARYRKEYVVRESVGILSRNAGASANDFSDALFTGQVHYRPDPLIRLPSLRESKWKVMVLQRWVGRVESISAQGFTAVTYDASNPQNPPEEVQLDGEEISPTDIPLLVEGATFYWAIGYRETPGGQRERVSTLRLARLPKLSRAAVTRLMQTATQVAEQLESD